MKIKRILCAVAVVVLAVSMCVGVAACGPNAKSVRGEEVSESEWKAAFEALTSKDAEFTVESLAKASVKYEHETMIHKTKWTANTMASCTYTKKGPIESKIGYSKVSYKGDKDSAENELGQKAGKKDIELYSKIEDNVIYNYEKNLNDEWEREEAYSSVVSGELSYIIYMANRYDYFEYSKEHKGYVVKGYEEGDALTVYKFKGGKLVAIYLYSEDFEEESEAQEYSKSTTITECHITIKYTAKEIKLPTVGK